MKHQAFLAHQHTTVVLVWLSDFQFSYRYFLHTIEWFSFSYSCDPSEAFGYSFVN